MHSQKPTHINAKTFDWDVSDALNPHKNTVLSFISQCRSLIRLAGSLCRGRRFYTVLPKETSELILSILQLTTSFKIFTHIKYKVWLVLTVPRFSVAEACSDQFVGRSRGRSRRNDKPIVCAATDF